MKLVVSGCSWSSRDRKQPGIEFGQLVADHFGWDYVNTAVVSASNFVIRLQIQYAIENLKPDFSKAFSGSWSAIRSYIYSLELCFC